MRALFLCLASLSLALTARAQDAGVPSDAGPSDAAPGDAAPSDAASAPPALDASELVPEAPPAPTAWTLFDHAVELATGGRTDEALAILDQLARDYPDHEANVRGAALRATIERRREAVASPERLDAPAPPDSYQTPLDQAPVPPPPVEQGPYSSFARGEILAFQTVHGLAIGAELCLSLDCSDEAIAGMLMLTTGGALALSAYLTGDGVRPSSSVAVNDGAMLGFGVGITTLALTGADDESLGYSLVLSQLLGIAVGWLIDDALEPTPGDVSLTFSGAIWSTVVMGLVMIGVDPADGEDTVAPALLAAMGFGTLGGALLTSVVPMSRTRALILDAGGMLGLLFGAGGVRIVGDESEEALAASGIVGVVLGISLAALLTRDLDLPSLPVAQLSLAPVDGGGIATLRAAF